MTKKDNEYRTYVLTLKDGDIRKITIPSSWKITFGNVVPYQGKDARHNNEQRIALRLYEGTKDNLRAVFTDVVSFRDISFPVLERRTTVQRQAAQKHTNHGMKDVVVEARVTEWVDPDDDKDDASKPNEFLKLTGESEF